MTLIYDRKVKDLSEEVFKTISELLSGGRLEEKRSEDGKIYYRLKTNDKSGSEIY